ncbi:MAG: GTPase ObgE [Candidatus Coatesbacteria bacterium]|nr:GTPase ObgE [Candidatus Coatesbacteria bacterium]
MFVDSATIRVKAGDGGSGCVSFRREKHVPRGGPNGGDGGNGGNVILVAKEGLKTLYDCQERHYFKAKRGAHGSGNNRHGKNGEDLYIPLPLGTVVTDGDTGQQLADLTRPDVEFLVAKGGKGGRGNTAFKSSTNKAPRNAEPGELGESKMLRLKLKILADGALVGLPNAGKSSLISAISAAQPKIADYPFTTKEPNLGTINTDNIFSFTMADIPGLVEGAHSGRGLGLKFLQHIQRAKVFVLVLDVSDSAPVPAIEAVETLMLEMGHFDATLPGRVRFSVANKIDLECSETTLAALREFCLSRGILNFELSALTGDGIEPFLKALSKAMSAREVRIAD